MTVQAEGSAPQFAHSLARDINNELDRLRQTIAALEKRLKALETP